MPARLTTTVVARIEDALRE